RKQPKRAYIVFKITQKHILIGAAAIGVYLYFAGLKNVAKNIGKGAVDAAAGLVVGVGQGFGIPETDATMCDISKRNGDVFGASKYCTASDFISWTFDGQPNGGASGDW
ncbi:MAG: hypothetical protein PHF58_13755, partial [Methylotenera sp.]|nr:hypothetical protein [Methylotenera sp.]